jgi:hypothetical protein
MRRPAIDAGEVHAFAAQGERADQVAHERHGAMRQGQAVADAGGAELLAAEQPLDGRFTLLRRQLQRGRQAAHERADRLFLRFDLQVGEDGFGNNEAERTRRGHG